MAGSFGVGVGVAVAEGEAVGVGVGFAEVVFASTTGGVALTSGVEWGDGCAGGVRLCVFRGCGRDRFAQCSIG